MDFEVCINSLDGAVIAAKHGAKRVELCTALNEGGLTPSIGLIEACSKVESIETFVMIRPRAGGFEYSKNELEFMARDIKVVKAAGAHGVVFGVLDNKSRVDIKKNVFLIETALSEGLGTTFHRAIDVSLDPLNELENIINIGFDRVLTSGMQSKAIEGISLIDQMNQKANGRIEIMAGSGINAQNVLRFQTVGINSVHFTAHQSVKENLRLDFGSNTAVNENKIESIAKLLV